MIETILPLSEQTPQFEHDCECCVFLGHARHGDQKADLYFHKGAFETSVVARFSSDGPDYTSGLLFAIRGLNVMLEAALFRALMDGLITREEVIKAAQ